MNFEDERKKLTEYISGFAVKSEKIKKAFIAVKRENFVTENKEHSYEDTAMPIGFGQTISQPSTIAIMLELLNAKEGESIAEVGSGCGYTVALLSHLVGEKGKVIGIEMLKELAEKSKKNLKKEGIKNTLIINADASQGIDELCSKKFDKILISCACPFVPKKIFDMLKEDGRIVAPVGDAGTQVLEIMFKKDGKPFKKSYDGDIFTFVPMKSKIFDY